MFRRVGAGPFRSITQLPFVGRDPSEDGLRVLTMRLWPRGVKREHTDAWDKELGPSRELLRTAK